MAIRFDVLLKNGWAVDPIAGLNGVVDVGVAGGRIAEIAPDLDPARAAEVFDAAGAHVVPGIIDLHMHASEWLGGRWGHRMMARVGVTTALDMSGPVGSVMRMLRDHGTGLNIACIEAVRPGLTVRDSNPDRAELEKLLRTALSGGAIGIKLLGGHYPLTPEATARAIATANAQRAYVAFHAGTTERGSNIEGLLQATELAAGHAVHIDHINSYCRGAIRPHMQETEEAIAALVAHPNLRSENYLSPLNGTSAKCSGGAPESRVTQQCLKVGGFPPTESGFEAAILAGWAEVNVEAGGEVILTTGKPAVDFWRGRGTDTTVSFRVNPPEPRLRLATAKRPDGDFVVDCIQHGRGRDSPKRHGGDGPGPGQPSGSHPGRVRPQNQHQPGSDPGAHQRGTLSRRIGRGYHGVGSGDTQSHPESRQRRGHHVSRVCLRAGRTHDHLGRGSRGGGGRRPRGGRRGCGEGGILPVLGAAAEPPAPCVSVIPERPNGPKGAWRCSLTSWLWL